MAQKELVSEGTVDGGDSTDIDTTDYRALLLGNIQRELSPHFTHLRDWPGEEDVLNAEALQLRFEELASANPVEVHESQLRERDRMTRRELEDMSLVYGDKRYFFKDELVKSGGNIARRVTFEPTQPLRTGEYGLQSRISFFGAGTDRLEVMSFTNGVNTVNVITVGDRRRTNAFIGPIPWHPGVKLDIADKYHLPIKPETREKYQAVTRR